MTLARFLAEVRTRTRTPLPGDLDPVWLILSHLTVNPHTVESKVLRKATLAVIETNVDMNDADLWTLGKDALGVLDAFAACRLGGRYKQTDLDIVADRLRSEAPP